MGTGEQVPPIKMKKAGPREPPRVGTANSSSGTYSSLNDRLRAEYADAIRRENEAKKKTKQE